MAAAGSSASEAGGVARSRFTKARKVTGEPSAGASARPRLRLVEGKPLAKGALRGFVSVELPIGLTIREMPVLVGNNGPWVSLSGKPQIDGSGQVKAR